MRRLLPLLCLMACGLLLSRCKDHDGIEFDYHEPHSVTNVMEMIPEDLVSAFGEEHFHFGINPTDLKDISFKVDGLQYVEAIRYIYGPDGNPVLSHAEMPPMDMTRYLHHFYNIDGSISSHRLKTIDPSNNQFLRQNDTVFVIGDSLNFTAYYIDSILEYASGNPVNAVIVSGMIQLDSLGQFLGIDHYRIGKKILRYGHQPTVPSYAPGTIEVKQHEGLCPAFIWDTRQQSSKP